MARFRKIQAVIYFRRTKENQIYIYTAIVFFYSYNPALRGVTCCYYIPKIMIGEIGADIG